VLDDDAFTVAVSPDGCVLASGSDDVEIRFLRTATDEEIGNRHGAPQSDGLPAKMRQVSVNARDRLTQPGNVAKQPENRERWY
jgi:hypothetical protein